MRVFFSFLKTFPIRRFLILYCTDNYAICVTLNSNLDFHIYQITVFRTLCNSTPCLMLPFIPSVCLIRYLPLCSLHNVCGKIYWSELFHLRFDKVFFINVIELFLCSNYFCHWYFFFSAKSVPVSMNSPNYYPAFNSAVHR